MGFRQLTILCETMCDVVETWLVRCGGYCFLFIFEIHNNINQYFFEIVVFKFKKCLFYHFLNVIIVNLPKHLNNTILDIT